MASRVTGEVEESINKAKKWPASLDQTHESVLSQKPGKRKLQEWGVSTGVEHDQEREQTEAPVGPWIWRWKEYR